MERSSSSSSIGSSEEEQLARAAKRMRIREASPDEMIILPFPIRVVRLVDYNLLHAIIGNDTIAQVIEAESRWYQARAPLGARFRLRARDAREYIEGEETSVRRLDSVVPFPDGVSLELELTVDPDEEARRQVRKTLAWVIRDEMTRIRPEDEE